MVASSLGQSEVSELSFKTKVLSPGAVVRVPCLRVPAAKSDGPVLRAVSVGLQVPVERLRVTRRNPVDIYEFVPEDPKEITRYVNPSIYYDIVIVPDETADLPTPGEIADRFRDVDARKMIKQLLPEFDDAADTLSTFCLLMHFLKSRQTQCTVLPELAVKSETSWLELLLLQACIPATECSMRAL